jgi:hypothetical protein
MWGDSLKHTTKALNCMMPPKPVPGHEGQSRLCISDPSMTFEKQLRTMFPFLCLAMKTMIGPDGKADFSQRAQMCVHLYYEDAKKAYKLLTIPNLYLTYSVEVRHISMTFPLRITNYLSSQLDRFTMPSVKDDIYSHIHGPGNILRSRRVAPAGLHTSLVESTPVQVRVPAAPAALPGPGWSSSRGYTPSAAGLQSLASVNATVGDAPKTSSVERPARAVYTPDQLAARTPKSYAQALGGPDSAYWVPSIKVDFATLRREKCFINVTDIRPPGRAPPGIEQRFKIKYREEVPTALEDLNPEAWKTRTIARGDRFLRGQHFDSTAAPVVHTPGLKCVVGWAVAKAKLFQADQNGAFYINEMDRKGIIVRLPPGFDPDSTDLRPLHLPALYAELAKSVPGIPQGSLLQYQALAPDIIALGFTPADADNCIFVHKTQDMAISLHVDDFILAAPSLQHATQIFGPAGLGSKRGIKWGPLESTLGIDFDVVYTAEKRMVFMSQRAYAVTILERGGMLDCNGARTPANPGWTYTKADCATDEQKSELRAKGLTKELYHSLVAAINYLVTITREDARFIVGKLAKYCNNPGPKHFKMLKHVLRFIKGTLDHGVEFTWRACDPAPADGPLSIIAFSDSSFADDIDTGRSTLGGVIQVNGTTVSAFSKLSSRVDSCVNHSELHAFAAASAPPSSSKAMTDHASELTDGASMALVKIGRTVTWLRGVKAALERRDVDAMPPTPILVDNNGVLSMLEGVTLKTANRHIYRSLAENRERAHIDKSVVAIKVHTSDNLADAMTKQAKNITASAAQLRQIAGPRSA